MWKSFSKLCWYPNFPQGTEISQSKLWSTKQTRPSNDTELLADGDVAWDYTPALDLTFSVFFECKPARRPHIQRADPSFEKEACRSHAWWPQPAPASTSHCHLSLFPVPFIISTATFHSPIHPSSGVGTYTCSSPQTSLVVHPLLLSSLWSTVEN